MPKYGIKVRLHGVLLCLSTGTVIPLPLHRYAMWTLILRRGYRKLLPQG